MLRHFYYYFFLLSSSSSSSASFFLCSRPRRNINDRHLQTEVSRTHIKFSHKSRCNCHEHGRIILFFWLFPLTPSLLSLSLSLFYTHTHVAFLINQWQGHQFLTLRRASSSFDIGDLFTTDITASRELLFIARDTVQISALISVSEEDARIIKCER